MPEVADDTKTATVRPTQEVDVVIVGAGVAGLYMLYKVRELGLVACVLEAGDGVGGTWYWNRYPGARCDVESLQYSYQFSDELQQEWEWSERYAGQAEILRYVNHVADRFDLRRDVHFSTRVESAIFDETSSRWLVATDRGDRVVSRFCVMATGCLSSSNLPPFRGRDDFEGESYHTGRWPHEGVDFTGKHVGVIGTGSSAVQSIPIIAGQAAEVTVFQRTPNFSVPARNRPMDPEVQAEVKASYTELRRRAAETAPIILLDRNDASALDATPAQREAEFEKRWQHGGFAFLGAYIDLSLEPEANDAAAGFVRRKIREIVDDPETAEVLCPDSTIGCKRLCLDTHYYETFNKEHVRLVDIRRSGIDEITPRGVRANGTEDPVDCIVYATGFDAMTGALMAIDIRGRGGAALRDSWSAGPRTYLGLGTVGFPNLFTITGPGSPSVLANMIPAIEQHVNWVADCIRWLEEEGVPTIEPKIEAQDDWVEHVNEVASATLLLNCNSWYLGANVPGKPRVFMPYVGGFPAYSKKCNEVAANRYEGFALGVASA
ncbi:MAG: NAD(P)/FAD-dependent oxidoreductase [Acidobacteriota bacterium]|nr:NAD(P)/FAD-dependent oxidoreductase [Acidobacteriota bacterium]